MRSSIDGESTNKFAGVAERKKAILVDELSRMSEQTQIFSGTRDVTKTRIFNFTPQGAANAAYKVAHNPAFKKITLHWSDHPDKSVGLYRVVDGVVQYIDKSYWTKDRIKKYQFRMDKPLSPRYDFRSPWYDTECDRANHPREIATELDIDYQGSDTNFFDQDILERMMKKTKDPMHVGQMDYSLTGPQEEWESEFVTMKGGPMRMWCCLDLEGRPPPYHKYIVGVDVSFGTGATNSCISVFDSKLNEQVAEWTHNRTDPFECAEIAIAICTMFYGAYLVWEGNGPGLTFEKQIVKIGYANFYYRRNIRKISQKATEQPGWWSSPDGKSALMGDFRRAFIKGTYIPRSSKLIDESRHYILLPNGGVEHRYAKEAEDASGAGYNHGDTTTAAALTLLGCEEVGEAKTVEPEIPDRCFASRRKTWEKTKKEKKRGHRFGKRFRISA